MGARPGSRQADHVGRAMAPRSRLFHLFPRQLREPVLARRHEPDRQDRPPHLLKKRNEKPYIVEASATDDVGAGEDESSSFLMTPTLSMVSAVGSLAGSSASATPAMSL